MRRRRFTIWELLVIVAIVVMIAMISMPLVNRSPHNASRMTCQSNLKQIILACKQYAQDNSELYPPVAIHDVSINDKRPLGWADAIQPYLKSQTIFWCPARIKIGDRDGKEVLQSEKEYTDYWYNRRMASKSEAELKYTASIILLGDGNDGTDATNARYSLSTLPETWRKDSKSPAHRHLEGANYGFVDGHVKWLRPAKVTGAKPTGSNHTFAIK